MKKIFSLIAAVLVAGAMFAAVETVTFSEQGYANGDAVETVSAASFTITFNKGTNKNNAPKYYTAGSSVRCYGGNYFTVTSSSTITSISMTFASGEGTNTITTDPQGFSTDTWTGSANSVKFTIDGTSGHRRIASITVTTGSGIVVPVLADGYYLVGSFNNWTAAANYKFASSAVSGEYKLSLTLTQGDEMKVAYVENETNTTWYPTGVNNNYIVDAAHAGANKTIYFRPEGCLAWDGFHEGNYFFIEENGQITTCSSARDAALTVASNNTPYNNGQEYTITGYVTSIATAFSAQNSNITFWMADEANDGNVLEAYRAACASAEDAPNVGDKVAVTGKLTKYNATPEFAAGCTFTIVERSGVEPQNLGEKTIAEFLALKNALDTCILTGVVDSIANTQYGNLFITDQTARVYVYGVLTADGRSQQFANMNVAVGDTLTILATYNEYNNAPQVKNAIFVSVKKASIDPEDLPVNLGEKTIAEFLQLKNTVDTCILTGVVDSIANTRYGNLYLSDETAQVYVYGVLTPDGRSQQFESLEVSVGDRLTILAIYSEYNNAPQVKNAIFVSVQGISSAIENVEVRKATKLIRNGEVIIIRDGVEYNILGSERR